MQIYTALISKNITPYTEGDIYLNDHVKVRIPNFHGPKTKEAYSLMPSDIAVTPNIATDDELPWAAVNRGFDNNTFSAQSFNEDDLVSVILLNDSINSPVIIGFASRFSYTEDPNVAENNKNFGIANIESLGGGFGGTGFSSVSGASSIVAIAENEVGYISKASDSQLEDKTGNPGQSGATPYTKYFKAATGSACGQWCAAFCWWCYDQAGCAEYFCGGHPYVSCGDIVNFYKKEGKFSNSTKDAKAGDLAFFDFNGGSDIHHVELICKDKLESENYIITIGGNTHADGQSGGPTCVAKKTRSSYVVGIAHTGAPAAQSYEGMDNTTNEGQVALALLKYLVFDGKPLNNAALSGILANLYHECNFNWTAEAIDTDGKPSFGLCQWHLNRYDKLKALPNHRELDVQVQYLKDELDNISDYSKTKSAIISAPNTVEGAKNVARTWASNFERCAEHYEGRNLWDEREKLAETEFWPKYKSVKLSPSELEQIFTEAGYPASKITDCVIVASCSDKTLQVFTKSKSEKIHKKELKDIKLKLGKNGYTSASSKTDTDKKTPLGLYELGSLLCVGGNPGISWTNVTKISSDSSLYWVNDSESIHYNTIVGASTEKDWSSAIDLSRNQSTYNFAIVVEYNTKTSTKPNKGCCIALQCGDKSTSTGSIALSEKDMKELLKKLDGYYGRAQVLLTK